MVTDPSAEDHPEPIVVATYSTLGEAEVAEAKLRAFGIDSALDDQIEGGTVPVDDEPVIVVRVRAVDATDARQILTDTDADADPDIGSTRTPSALIPAAACWAR